MNKIYTPTYHLPPKNAMQKYYRKNREKFIERNRKRKKLFKDYYQEAKNHPCVDCGIQYHPIIMEFDHRDPTTKLFNVSQPQSVSSLKKLKDELAKCDVVCANCHKLRTWRVKS